MKKIRFIKREFLRKTACRALRIPNSNSLEISAIDLGLRDLVRDRFTVEDEGD